MLLNIIMSVFQALSLAGWGEAHCQAIIWFLTRNLWQPLATRQSDAHALSLKACMQLNAANNPHEVGSSSFPSCTFRWAHRPDQHHHCNLAEDQAKSYPNFWPTEAVWDNKCGFLFVCFAAKFVVLFLCNNVWNTFLILERGCCGNKYLIMWR